MMLLLMGAATAFVVPSAPQPRVLHQETKLSLSTVSMDPQQRQPSDENSPQAAVMENTESTEEETAPSVAPRAVAGLLLVAMPMAFVLLTTMSFGGQTEAYTMQEWQWALRDGYVPTMITHYMHNGGL